MSVAFQLPEQLPSFALELDIVQLVWTITPSQSESALLESFKHVSRRDGCLEATLSVNKLLIPAKGTASRGDWQGTCSQRSQVTHPLSLL